MAENLIGADEEIETEMIRTNTGEVLGPMTDDIVGPALNRFKAELRTKIESVFNIKGNE